MHWLLLRLRGKGDATPLMIGGKSRGMHALRPTFSTAREYPPDWNGVVLVRRVGPHPDGEEGVGALAVVHKVLDHHRLVVHEGQGAGNVVPKGLKGDTQ